MEERGGGRGGVCSQDHIAAAHSSRSSSVKTFLQNLK